MDAAMMQSLIEVRDSFASSCDHHNFSADRLATIVELLRDGVSMPEMKELEQAETPLSLVLLRQARAMQRHVDAIKALRTAIVRKEFRTEPLG